MPKCELLDPNMYWGGIKHYCGDVLDLTLEEIAFVESLAPRQRLKVYDEDSGAGLCGRDEVDREGDARSGPGAGKRGRTAVTPASGVQRKPSRRKGADGPAGAMGA